jgi:hypothetical protein
MKHPYQTKRHTYCFPLPTPNIITAFQPENLSSQKLCEVPKYMWMLLGATFNGFLQNSDHPIWPISSYISVIDQLYQKNELQDGKKSSFTGQIHKPNIDPVTTHKPKHRSKAQDLFPNWRQLGNTAKRRRGEASLRKLTAATP